LPVRHIHRELALCTTQRRGVNGRLHTCAAGLWFGSRRHRRCHRRRRCTSRAPTACRPATHPRRRLRRHASRCPPSIA
jgi:hypothetical protein